MAMESSRALCQVLQQPQGSFELPQEHQGDLEKGVDGKNLCQLLLYAAVYPLPGHGGGSGVWWSVGGGGEGWDGKRLKCRGYSENGGLREF